MNDGSNTTHTVLTPTHALPFFVCSLAGQRRGPCLSKTCTMTLASTLESQGELICTIFLMLSMCENICRCEGRFLSKPAWADRQRDSVDGIDEGHLAKTMHRWAKAKIVDFIGWHYVHILIMFGNKSYISSTSGARITLTAQARSSNIVLDTRVFWQNEAAERLDRFVAPTGVRLHVVLAYHAYSVRTNASRFSDDATRHREKSLPMLMDTTSGCVDADSAWCLPVTLFSRHPDALARRCCLHWTRCVHERICSSCFESLVSWCSYAKEVRFVVERHAAPLESASALDQDAAFLGFPLSLAQAHVGTLSTWKRSCCLQGRYFIG